MGREAERAAGQSAAPPAARGRCQGSRAGMAARRSDRCPPDALLNRFHAERARKERRWQLLFTQYTVNPLQPGEASGPQGTAVKARGQNKP